MPMRPHPIQPSLLVAALFVLVAVTALLALSVGDAAVPPGEVLRAIRQAISGDAGNDATSRILLAIRLPRIVMALAAGAAMGLAGLASQTLFRNPLASPYVVGVSSGAACGAVLGLLLAAPAVGFAAMPVMSVLGGLAATLAVYGFARRGGHFGHSLLLAGIAVSAFCSALTSATLYLAGEQLQTLVFWLMGGLWQSSWRDALVMTPVACAAGVALLALAPAMDVALVGERSARDLGVAVRRLQLWLLVIVAVTTSVAVSLTGVIGFVGLIVPHLLRLLCGAGHRGLVPASALGGALLLLAADTLARTAAAPAEIPVGILTALVGAPVFLWLLLRRSRQGATP
ncbi:MAG TPA: iron ABC transporter permease [Phycisphaerae bacterium]|nr:iron ABC transporter permease [Phycisphaerae bacterium]